MTILQLRQQSRTFFPTWSRHMRAVWIMAKLRAPAQPKIGTAQDILLDQRYFSTSIQEATGGHILQR